MYCHLFMKVCTCHRLQATCHVIHLLARQVIACVTNNFTTLTKHVHMSDLWRICSKCQTPFQDAMRMTLILLSASAYSQTRIILTVWPRVGSCVVVFMRGLSSPLSRTIALMSSFDQLFVIAKYFQCRYRLLREVRGHRWLPVHSHLDML